MKILWLVVNENQVVDRHCVGAGDSVEERKLVTVYLVKFSKFSRLIPMMELTNDHCEWVMRK